MHLSISENIKIRSPLLSEHTDLTTTKNYISVLK